MNIFGNNNTGYGNVFSIFCVCLYVYRIMPIILSNGMMEAPVVTTGGMMEAPVIQCHPMIIHKCTFQLMIITTPMDSSTSRLLSLRFPTSSRFANFRSVKILNESLTISKRHVQLAAFSQRLHNMNLMHSLHG